MFFDSTLDKSIKAKLTIIYKMQYCITISFQYFCDHPRSVMWSSKNSLTHHQATDYKCKREIERRERDGLDGIGFILNYFRYDANGMRANY